MWHSGLGVAGKGVVVYLLVWFAGFAGFITFLDGIGYRNRDLGAQAEMAASFQMVLIAGLGHIDRLVLPGDVAGRFSVVRSWPVGDVNWLGVPNPFIPR